MVAEVLPMRTCVGCRAKAASSDLVRVVAVDGTLVPDIRRVLPGRGAHVHATSPCIEAADRRRAWARALRVAGPVDGSAVRELGTSVRDPKAVPPTGAAHHRVRSDRSGQSTEGSGVQ